MSLVPVLRRSTLLGKTARSRGRTMSPLPGTPGRGLGRGAMAWTTSRVLDQATNDTNELLALAPIGIQLLDDVRLQESSELEEVAVAFDEADERLQVFWIDQRVEWDIVQIELSFH